ncbi:hypothetical protein [Streptomyces sp. NPDC059072]|uniref:hypothetical protein n=1 Tax=Streptomyces sp. NPDC059072 TaxID=3346715 RepID=UPI0036D076F8
MGHDAVCASTAGRAAGGGELVASYERAGFIRTDPFLEGARPGQVLAGRVD